MAETTGTARSTTGATTRKTTATKRSTAAKKAAATRSRNQAATARKRSTAAKKAAETRRELAKTPVERIAETAERAVLIPVGATLIARDAVVDTVDELRGSLSSREKAEKELQLRRRRLEAEIKRFERRGATARTKAERELRQRRNRFEREVKSIRKDLDKQTTARVKDLSLVTARVENLVQTGITAGTKAATTVQERLASVA